MKKIVGEIVGFIYKIPLMVRSLKKIYRVGGFTSITVAYVSHGSLLKGKKILVTGGSQGIGFCIAKNCVNEGAEVVITGRNESSLQDAAKKISSPLLKTLVWDIGETSKIKEGLDGALSLLNGELDILVNNAGIIDGSDFPNVSVDVWDKIYAVNSKGVFFLSQEVGKLWMHPSPGKSIKKIINISSQGGFVGATYPYRMTKWDVAGFTQGLGVKLAPYGIIVNGIAPGIVFTNMQSNLLAKNENVYLPLNPLQRYALPEEVAELAVFLIGDASNFIVGQTIVCDGGFSLK